MSAPKLKVLICGAGIAGPCLAYWLTRTRLDVSITIVERSSTPRVTGQSIDVRGPAIQIIKDMHLEEAIRARHTTEEGTHILNSQGKPFAQFSAGDTFTAEYEILRADLCELFLKVTKDSPNVKYLYGDSVKSLNRTEKSVQVAFASGTNPTDSFDLVIAADGSASKTRSMILPAPILQNSHNFLGQYIAYFSISRLPTDPKIWQWYNRPKGVGIMLRPHRNDATMGAYLCITLPSRGARDAPMESAIDEGPDATKRLLHKYLDDVGWQAKRILAGMDTADDFYISRAAQVKLPKWTEGRGVVIGDAAFATFGVGTTLAITSAYVLAGELSKVQNSSEDVPQALERYENIFRPVYGEMEELPPFFPQCAFPQTQWALWLRDSLLWVVSKTGLYRMFQGGSEGEKWKLPAYDWVMSK